MKTNPIHPSIEGRGMGRGKFSYNRISYFFVNWPATEAVALATAS